MTAIAVPAAGVRLRKPGTSQARRILKGGAILFATVIGLVVVIVVAGSIARALPRQLIAPTGLAAVGRTELLLTDRSRVDPFATDGRMRELSVWIWYPTAGTAGRKAPYLPAAWADAANQVNGPAAFLFQDNNSVQTNSIAGAQLQGRPPVVVLMPGLGNSVPEYTTIAEDLASHGYAVVGINMTGSSLVGFPDGHLTYGTTQGSVNETNVTAWYPQAERVTTVWAKDAAFVVASLAQTPPAIGALDFSRVAYVGHSLGGAASFEACRQDSHCATAIDLDGSLWTDVRHTGLKVPSLILRHPNATCDAFCEAANTDFAQVKATGTRLLTLEGSEHLNFSDSSVLFEPALHPLGFLGPIDGARAILITRDVLRSFLDAPMRGAPAAGFESTVGRYSELR